MVEGAGEGMQSCDEWGVAATVLGEQRVLRYNGHGHNLPFYVRYGNIVPATFSSWHCAVLRGVAVPVQSNLVA